MKKTSKFVAFILAGVLCVSLLAGCTGNESPTASAESLNTERTETTENKNENEQLDSDTLVIAEQGIFLQVVQSFNLMGLLMLPIIIRPAKAPLRM